MKLIWTRMEVFGKDDIITWAFDHEVSHFAIEFFNGSAILHSDMYGIEVLEPESFYKKRVKIYEIPLEVSHEQEAKTFEAMVKRWGRRKYDFTYFFSLAKQGVRKKFFGKNIDYKQVKHNKEDIICHELFQLIPDNIRPNVDVTQAVMPELLYKIIKEWTETKD